MVQDIVDKIGYQSPSYLFRKSFERFWEQGKCDEGKDACCNGGVVNNVEPIHNTIWVKYVQFAELKVRKKMDVLKMRYLHCVIFRTCSKDDKVHHCSAFFCF